MNVRSWALHSARPLLLFAAAIGCGGRVDLGGKHEFNSNGTPFEDPKSSGQPRTAGDVIAKVADDFTLQTLAVSGNDLYLLGFGNDGVGLFRCGKESCSSSLRPLNVNGHFDTLQVYADRLGVSNWNGSRAWLGTYDLPELSNPQIAIGDLPQLVPGEPYFHDGFVYWSLVSEKGLYRCELPDCARGPERIHRQSAYGPIRAEGELLFWTDGSSIYRAGAHGSLPAQSLVPDEQLGPAPDEPGSTTPPALSVASLDVAEGMVYASFQYCETGCSCRIARWPILGGPREILVESATSLGRVLVAGSELAWTEKGPDDMSNVESATLVSCRVESCAATRRELGHVIQADVQLVADESHWYWLAAEQLRPDELGEGPLVYREVRRAPRLLPP